MHTWLRFGEIMRGSLSAQLHVSALNLRDAEEITTGLRVEFCWINGSRGPSTANVYPGMRFNISVMTPTY
ncbi:cold shock domain-containing protein [Escherichia coli]|uniref:cold shock domain-containing protein n=1 Tax=Escherichia coli TaxID=562 RepID=UPI001FCE559F|nr:cold shock domain-containing protein [Escherichia coli]